MLAVYAREARSWREEEVEALAALAGNVSAFLSNAELYQRVVMERERSVAILGNVADGIVAVDREGNVVLWNAAAEEITDVPASEAMGRSPADVLQRSLEADETSAEGRGLIQIRRAEEEVWLSVSEAVMRDPAGAVSGRIYAFRDVSSDRLVEQLKSGFVSTVSHELRAPLTSIYGFAETLLRDDVAFGDEERRTFLGYIASEAQRLTGIVDALLSVARLESGDLQVQFAPTDLREIDTLAIAPAGPWIQIGGTAEHRFGAPATFLLDTRSGRSVRLGFEARVVFSEDGRRALAQPILVDRIFEIIVEINKQGTTVLVVEQNASIALSVANRGYVLETGEIKLSDNADALRENDEVRKLYLGEV